MSWLAEKTVLVTGGGSGIGRAIVERFLEEDARVGTLDLDEDRLKELSEAYPSLVTVHGDVTSYADNEQAVAETEAAFGTLDVFVGNAGIFDDNVSVAEIPEDVEDTFTQLFGVNVLGYILGAKAALPSLVESEGRMVFTASGASFDPDGGGVLYVPSKHAVAGLIRQLAFELAPTVSVNGVAPGYIPTNLESASSLGGENSFVSPDEFDATVHPLDYVPEPQDYTGAYVLLAAEDESRPMTGTIIRADLGRSVRGIGEISGRALSYITEEIDD